MDECTREALELSIVKWEKNLEAARELRFKDVKTSEIDCPLCDLFIRNGCGGCPVSERTGTGYCRGTPYDRVYKAYIDKDEDNIVSACEDELAFLKSLLPKEEKP